MARAWLIGSRGIARKVKNASQFPTNQIKDCGANRECPNCHHCIDNSDVSLEWPGLPAGVKFDPSDAELLEHLAGKVGLGNSKAHFFIDEFIPTLQGDNGICYTHPENLPGAKIDGSSVHFFHRTSRAYATGHRKRRKINGQCSSTDEHFRWHKTGATKAVIENGVQKGWKKIMVLYKSLKNGSKPSKSNWVLHQYHLGDKEDEEEGEFVVSKICHQLQPNKSDKRPIKKNNSDKRPIKKKSDRSNLDLVIDESVTGAARASPSTPKTYTPNPRTGKRALLDEDDENIHKSPAKDAGLVSESPQPPLTSVHLEDKQMDPVWWAGESQAVEDLDPNGVHASLLCNEILDSYAPIDESGQKRDPYFFNSGGNRNNMLEGDIDMGRGFSDLGNLELETPPDFDLADLQFGSQESFTSWLDRL